MPSPKDVSQQKRATNRVWSGWLSVKPLACGCTLMFAGTVGAAPPISVINVVSEPVESPLRVTIQIPSPKGVLVPRLATSEQAVAISLPRADFPPAVRNASAVGMATPPAVHEFAERAPAQGVSFLLPRYQLSVFEREVLAACLVLEAACQGEFGMRGVMAVIRNRAEARPELFAPTVLRRRQFSAFNRVTAGRESIDHAIERAQRDRMWSPALAIVTEAATESWEDPTAGATHYHRAGERRRWTRPLALTAHIGVHAFYR